MPARWQYQGKFGLRRNSTMGRGSQRVGALGMAIFFDPLLGNKLVGTPLRSTTAFRSVFVGTMLGPFPHRARAPAGHTPPSFSDDRVPLRARIPFGLRTTGPVGCTLRPGITTGPWAATRGTIIAFLPGTRLTGRTAGAGTAAATAAVAGTRRGRARPGTRSRPCMRSLSLIARRGCPEELDLELESGRPRLPDPPPVPEPDRSEPDRSEPDRSEPLDPDGRGGRPCPPEDPPRPPELEPLAPW